MDFSSRPFRVEGDSGDFYVADTVVIATGAQARWLGLPSEKRLQGAGVSACATCDGFFYRGKRVAVIGGGNTAVEEALYLTHHADKVTLVHRRDCLRAEKILQRRLFAHPKIEVIWNSVVEEVVGAGQPEVVTGLRLRDLKSDALSTLDVDGVFIAIGHMPNTTIFRGQVELDDEGYVLTRPGQTLDLGPRRVRRGRRAGQALAPGSDRGRHRLHRRAGGRAVPHAGSRAACRGGGVGRRP